MVSVDANNKITMTRGDTLRQYIRMVDVLGNEYLPSPTDRIIFSVKRRYSDDECVIQKEVPINTQILHLTPEDTKPLEMHKTYYYDVQLVRNNGDVDTFIAKAKLKIDEEVG